MHCRGFGFDWPKSHPIKGPYLALGCLATSPVMPGRGPGPWQVTATGLLGDVQVVTLDPASHVLSALEAMITFNDIDRTTSCIPPFGTPLPGPGPTATTSRYMGAGENVQGKRSEYGLAGLGLAYSIGVPLGVVVGLGMLFFCGYICTRSGTQEIVDAAASSGRRNQPTRLEITLSNRP